MMAQNGCSNAVYLDSDTSYFDTNNNQQYYWLKIEAEDESFELRFNTNNPNDEVDVVNAQLYSGDCNNLAEVMPSFYETGEYYSFDGLVPQNNYFILLTFPYGDDGIFEFYYYFFQKPYHILQCPPQPCEMVKNATFSISNDHFGNESHSNLATNFSDRSSVCGWYSLNGTPQVKIDNSFITTDTVLLTWAGNYFFGGNINEPRQNYEAAGTKIDIEANKGYILHLRFRMTAHPSLVNLSCGAYPQMKFKVELTTVGNTYSNPLNSTQNKQIILNYNHTMGVSTTLGWIDYTVSFTAEDNWNTLAVYPVIPSDPPTGNTCAYPYWLFYAFFDDIYISCVEANDNPAKTKVYYNPKASELNIDYSAGGNAITTDDYINIHGTLLIDEDISFAGCELFFGPNARVEYDVPATLTFSSSYLSGVCCMWDGIYLKDPSERLNFDACEISDARNAVVTENNGRIDISGCFFSNNHKAIVARKYAPQSPVSYNATITNNTFSGSTNLMYPYQGEKSLYGIELDHVYDFPIGVYSSQSPNTFSNLMCGVFSRNSSATIQNNVFVDFQVQNQPVYPNPPDYTQVYNETAIHAFWTHRAIQGYTSPSSRSFEVGDLTSSTPSNTFENCYNGILTYNLLPIIKNNAFNTLTNGIQSIDGYEPIRILNNTLEAVDMGIVAKSHTPSPNTLIIAENVLYDPKCGIWVINYQADGFDEERASLVRDNHVYFDNAVSGTTYGIRLNSCKFLQANGNLIYNSLSAPGSFNAASPFRGIDVSSSQYCIVKNNFITKTGLGFRVTGQCNYTEFLCNQMTDCYHGFYFDTHAQITHQGDPDRTTDNQWIGNYGSSGERKMKLNVNDHNLLPNQEWWYLNTSLVYDPELDNDFAGLIDQFSANSPIYCQDPPDLLNMSAGQRDALWLDVVSDSLDYTLFEEENRYLAVKSVFRELFADTTLLNKGTSSDSIFQAFYDSLMQTNLSSLLTLQQNMVAGDFQQAALLLDNFEPDPNVIEENYAIVYEIYLRTVTEDIFVYEPEDLSALYDVAIQLPYTGGDAVYTARIMLGFDPDEYDVSYRYSKPQPTMKNSGKIKVFPNPVVDKLTIMMSDCSEGEYVTLQLLDYTGKILISEQKLMLDGQVNLNLQSIKNGLYLLKVSRSNVGSESVKIVVSK